jgi:iron complex outermembrane receptor protein
MIKFRYEIVHENNNHNMTGGNITLRHYLDSGIMTWASISRGYKAGGFNLSLSVPEAFREYDPEFLINYETEINSI